MAGIIEANDAFLKIVGYDHEDLVAGRVRWTDLTTPGSRERTEAALLELERTGTIQPFEKEYFRKDGARVPALVGVAAFDEEREQLVAFVLDLTERKRAEAGARASELRYAEVQAELAHANRVATMGQLTASIAHEVNQPITASVTNAHAALRWLGAVRPNLDEVRLALGRIVENGNRAGAVISRIRALIKKAPPRNDRVSINDAIREVIELTRAEATKNGVSVRTQLADKLPTIMGDRVQLQQVILNLVVNAIEAMSGRTTRGENCCSAPSGPSRRVCMWRCRTPVRDWRRGPRSTSLRPSTPANRAAWGLGSQSAARSSRRTADNCGRPPMNPAARSSSSRRPPIRRNNA